MFGLDAVTHLRPRTAPAAGCGSARSWRPSGWCCVVFGSLRSGRSDSVAFAVGGYIAAAYWFTCSTSFANPAVTVARMFSDTFAGIAPALGARLRADAAGRRRPGARPGRLPLPVACARPRSSHDQFAPPVPPASRTVLFVCVHNAGPLADGRRLPAPPGRWRIEVLSAGSEPADQINPMAVAGDGRGGHRHRRRPAQGPRPRRRPRADVVVTMGCGDACPFFPGTRYEDWELDDPAGQADRGGPADPRRDPAPRRGADRRAAAGAGQPAKDFRNA